MFNLETKGVFTQENYSALTAKFEGKLQKNKLKYKLLNCIINHFGKRELKKQHIAVSQNIDGNSVSRKKAVLPSIQDWAALKKEFSKKKNKKKAKIDIIIPVYSGYEETLRCVYSVLNSDNKTEFELVVINDKSPDDKITQSLRELSNSGLFTLIENEKNLGFLKTMNFGMQLHPERDVIWLNSDTETFNNWIDRICEIAELNPKIASITPLSNNATICSYPRILTDNSSEFADSDEEIDKLAGQLFDKKYEAIPTGVGCCMYVRREALNKIGLLDEVFNLGYGEENDLCQRFLKSGYINVCTPSVFIRHYGSISFKERAAGLCRENSIILQKKHPTYVSQVEDWILRDPLRKYRIILDCVRLNSQNFNDPYILHVLHDLGGGTLLFVNNLIKDLEKENINSIKIFPSGKGNIYFDVDGLNYPNLQIIPIYSGKDELSLVFKYLNIKSLHIHSLYRWPSYFVDIIESIHREQNFNITVSLHDFHCCCSKIKILDYKGNLCNKLDRAECFNCDRINLPDDISTFVLRRNSKKLFAIANKVIVPSNDLKNRIQPVFPNVDFLVIPHRDEKYQTIKIDKRSKIFTICTVGRITEEKGLSVLSSLAKYIHENNLKAKIKVIGEKVKDDPYIQFLGKYNTFDEEISLIRKARPSIFFLPAIWPETFSLTLSEMLRTDVPIACFDIGAPAERLRKLGLGDFVIPFDKKDNPEEIFKHLEKICDLDFSIHQIDEENNRTIAEKYY